MIHETVRRELSTVTVKVAGNEVTGVRSATETETVARVYSEGRVGMASAVGTCEESGLRASAEEALSYGVPHPGPVSGGQQAGSAPVAPNGEALVSATEELLARLAEEHPRFVFTHSLAARCESVSLQNSADTSLRGTFHDVSGSLIAKELGSASIFDCFVAQERGERLEVEEMLAQARRRMGCFFEPLAQVKPGRQRVLFYGVGPLSRKLCVDLMLRRVATGASVFNNPRGPLAEHFWLGRRNRGWRPGVGFDLEGTLHHDVALIEGGTVCGGASDRRDAARHDACSTGYAAGELSRLPATVTEKLDVGGTKGSLVDLLDGEEALLVMVSAGADCSAVGDYAVPVQLGYRVAADGTFLQRLPQLTLSGNLFDVFGADYVGATSEPAHALCQDNFMLTHMNVA